MILVPSLLIVTHYEFKASTFYDVVIFYPWLVIFFTIQNYTLDVVVVFT